MPGVHQASSGICKIIDNRRDLFVKKDCEERSAQSFYYLK